MSIASEVGLTCARELRRNVRSIKGLVSLVLYLLGGGAAVVLITTLGRAVDDHGGRQLNDAARTGIRRQILMAVYDNDTAIVDYLVRAPFVLHWLYGATLLFTPLLVMLVSYDQLAGEVQYRTFRYATVRARRPSLVAGKALASWLAASLMALVLSVLAWVLTIARGDASVGVTLEYGVKFWLMACFFSASYAGLTSLVSSFFRTPIYALMSVFGVSFALAIVRAVLTAYVQSLPEWLRWTRYLFPGTWEPRLLSPNFTDYGLGVLVCVAFGAVCVAGASFVLNRRDV